MVKTSKPKIFYGYIIVLAALCISVVMWGTRHSFGVFFEPVLDDDGHFGRIAGAQPVGEGDIGMVCVEGNEEMMRPGQSVL